MTTHGRYDWTVSLTGMIFGKTDQIITLVHDLEVMVDIHCEINAAGELETYCLDVLIDDVSLRNGDALSQAIRSFVIAKADEELEQGGWLFEQVSNAEGLSLTGVPGDPDAHWQIAAE